MRGARFVARLALVSLLLGGCWDLRELNHMALVMAVGIDKAETPGRVLVTAQIARPSGAGRGKSSGGAGDQMGSVYTASAEGDTIFAAVRNMAQFVSRRIMWAHNNAVIIGEDLAREDITSVIDFFTRNQELRMRTWMVVARGERAQTLVAAKTGMEEVPANALSALFRYAQLPGESARTDVNEVAAEFFAPDAEPIVAAMRMREGANPVESSGPERGSTRQIELSGTAVFRHNKLAGFLDRDAGRGLLWLRGEMKNAVLTVPCPGATAKQMAIEVRSPKSVVTSTIVGGKPQFLVSVDTDGLLAEQDCATGKMGSEEIQAYAQREFAARIEANIRAALTTLQEELRTDAVKFGRRVHVEHPDWWRANRHRWDEIFPTVKTRYEIRVRVPKMGLYILPMRPKDS